MQHFLYQTTSHHRRASRSRGFSLVEILVGVAIGLVVMVAIFQIFRASTSSTRTTAAGNEAQISGSIGMYQIERDLKVAGHGFGSAGTFCNNVTGFNTVPAAVTFDMKPVNITFGAGAAPDSIQVLYGNSVYAAKGHAFDFANATSTRTKKSRVGLQLGDMVILTNAPLAPTACQMVQITDNTDADLLTVSHGVNASYNTFYSTPTVPAGTSVTTNQNANLVAGLQASTNGMLYNLGPEPKLMSWSVNGNNSLQVANLLGTSVANTVAEGVVSLKAQYGVDLGAGGGPAVANDGIISPTEWISVQPADWSKVLAVRFAVLARSQAMENDNVTAASSAPASAAGLAPLPTWSGGAFTLAGADWQRYRYRVYESTVALPNMLWGR